jgi:hypothetical protein
MTNGSLVAWGFIPNYSCAATGPCTKADNMGWRYQIYTLGALTFTMFIARSFLFHLYESPKFLLSRGRTAEAVATVHGIAYKNKRTTWLNEEILNEIGGVTEKDADQGALTTTEIVKRTLGKFSTERIAPLFATRQLALSTSLIWFCWATIGMGCTRSLPTHLPDPPTNTHPDPLFNAFLPQYLANAGKDLPPTPTNVVYRNYVITSVVGVPGSLIACYLVDVPYIGRKGTIAGSTMITGVLLFIFTISNKPDFQVAMSSLEAFFQNIMYGVLYAYTPEVFPAPNRGTGTGIASFFNRLAGLCAPIVAVNAGGVNPNAPVYAAGSLILAAFVAMCFFPIETRGRQSL